MLGQLIFWMQKWRIKNMSLSAVMAQAPVAEHYSSKGKLLNVEQPGIGIFTFQTYGQFCLAKHAQTTK